MRGVLRCFDGEVVWCCLLDVPFVENMCAMRLIVVFCHMCYYVCRLDKFVPRRLRASLGLARWMRRALDASGICGLPIFGAVLAGFGADFVRRIAM